MTISSHHVCRVITSWYHDYQSPLILSYYLHIMLPRLPVTTDTIIVLPTNCRLHLTAGAEYTYSYGGATAYDPQSPRRRVVSRSCAAPTFATSSSADIFTPPALRVPRSALLSAPHSTALRTPTRSALQRAPHSNALHTPNSKVLRIPTCSALQCDPHSNALRTPTHSALQCAPHSNALRAPRFAPAFTRFLAMAHGILTMAHGMDEPHTTIPHLVAVPICLSPKVPAPLRRSTSMRSPHLPVAGARVHAFPHIWYYRAIHTSRCHDYQSLLILSCYLHVTAPRLSVTADIT